MSEDKRKRCPNWLPSEKQLLIDLVEIHFEVVENKKTDTITMKQKHAEWKKIAHEYNSKTENCLRTYENLKAQWESLKKSAKKEQHKMQSIQTGGDPLKEKLNDPIHDRIIGLIATSARGLNYKFDRDSAYIKVDNNSETEAINTELVIIDENTNYQGLSSKDWGDYPPRLLKAPVSRNLMQKNKPWAVRRRLPYSAAASSSLELLHKKKVEAVDLQKTLACEERNQARRLTELEIEIKKEQLKQEKLKTRLLILELRKKRK